MLTTTRTPEDFSMQVLEQDVLFHPELEAAIRNQAVSDKGNYYTPSSILAGIAQAAYLLRNRPNVELVNTEITLQDAQSASVELLTFANILNASRGLQTAPLPAYTLSDSSPAYIDNCFNAEPMFGRILALIDEDPLSNTYNNVASAYQIICDGMQPVFLRKGCGKPSALSLVPIALNGIPYPPGSLWRVDLRWDKSVRSGNSFAYNLNYTGYKNELIPFTSVTHASFMRLSAFALPCQEREPFAVHFSKLTIEDTTIRECDMSQIQERMLKAMTALGQQAIVAA